MFQIVCGDVNFVEMVIFENRYACLWWRFALYYQCYNFGPLFSSAIYNVCDLHVVLRELKSLFWSWRPQKALRPVWEKWEWFRWIPSLRLILRYMFKAQTDWNIGVRIIRLSMWATSRARTLPIIRRFPWAKIIRSRSEKVCCWR